MLQSAGGRLMTGEDGWRPIDDEAKTGKLVWLCSPGRAPVLGRWVSPRMKSHDGYYLPGYTFWKPLEIPDPPKPVDPVLVLAEKLFAAYFGGDLHEAEEYPNSAKIWKRVALAAMEHLKCS